MAQQLVMRAALDDPPVLDEDRREEAQESVEDVGEEPERGGVPEGDAAVAHLDDVELGVLRESATAVVLLLGGIPGVDERVDPAAGGLRGGDRSDEAPAPEAEDQASVDARFEALTAGLHPTVPGQDDPARFGPLGVGRISFGPIWQMALTERSNELLARWR